MKLGHILDATRERVRMSRSPTTPTTTLPTPPNFKSALRGRETLSVIAEIKRRSPSRGDIARDDDIIRRARIYDDAGAVAISVLTEPSFFGGSLDDLRAVAEATRRPVLMKDFVIDPVQLELGSAAGASAALLLVRILSDDTLQELLAACREFGLAALVECHDEREIDRALALGATIIGVNNRDLDTFAVDTDRALGLVPRLPKNVVTVAESGYDSAASVRPLCGLADAVLVGTALMRRSDPRDLVREMTS